MGPGWSVFIRDMTLMTGPGPWRVIPPVTAMARQLTISAPPVVRRCHVTVLRRIASRMTVSTRVTVVAVEFSV